MVHVITPDRDTANRAVATKPAAPSDDSIRVRNLVETVAEEVVVVDELEAQQHRYRLRTMTIEMAKTPALEAWPHWHDQIQTELKNYRQQTEKRVRSLRSDLEQTAEALQEYVIAFADGGQNEEQRLKRDLSALQQLRQKQTVPELHDGLAAIASRLSGTIDEIQKRNQLVVTQLQDEIRTLQRRLEQAERRQGQTANISQRASFEKRVQERIQRGDDFCLFLVRIPNWSHILQTETAERASILISEVHSRLNESLGADTFAGRWYDGYLTALVPLDKRAAMDASDELVRQLSGRYPVPDGASTKMLQISVRIAVLDHFKGQTAEHLLKRVDQLIRAFEQR